MPCTYDLTTIQGNVVPEMVPQVYVDGNLSTQYRVIKIDRRLGTVPGKAMLHDLRGQYISGPMTLNRYTDGRLYAHGKRIRIANGDGTLFLGSILGRTDQGADDTVLWTSIDDRYFLSILSVRGALVSDSSGAKLIPRYLARMNPNGFWNCTGATVNGITVPIFSQVARLGKRYEAPDEAFTGELPTNGDPVPWTPRRALQYFQALANLVPGAIDGFPTEWGRSLYGNPRVQWTVGSVTGMFGADPGNPDLPDPLDKKMPDITFQGMTILAAIDRVLKACGTHDIGIDLDGDVSSIAFKPSGYSGIAASVFGGQSIRLQRGGSATNINTAYDFTMDEDSSETVGATLVEGEVVKVESPAAHLQVDATDALIPGWTDEQQNWFLYSINGGGGQNDDPKYAKINYIQGGSESGWMDADGNGGRPLVWARSGEAVQLARAMFPKVFRAWKLRSEKLSTALAGAMGWFTDTKKYPVLDCARPAYPEQLQFLVENLDGGDGIENSARVNYPVRVQVRNGTLDVWIEAYTSIRVDGEGLIWIDSLAEAADASPECVYAGSLFGQQLLFDSDDKPSITLKQLTVNLAMPLDHRVVGYAQRIDTGEFSTGFLQAIGGGIAKQPLAYIDSPGAYAEAHQVNSSPAPDARFWGGSSGTSSVSAPLTRLLPPGTERMHAVHAAERALALRKKIRSKSTFKMIGIRPEYVPGLWISEIEVAGGSEYDSNYRIDAPIESVMYDFNLQETVIGGMIGIV